jgi:hypothetical protein
MTEESGWTIAVVDALRAHFKQADGTSRPGVDWAVSLTKPGQERRIIIRSYSDEVPDQPSEKAAQSIVSFVAGLLGSGWSPEQYSGAPGDLVCAATVEPKKKPWWRF